VIIGNIRRCNVALEAAVRGIQHMEESEIAALQNAIE
jgi:hypothetical protein